MSDVTHLLEVMGQGDPRAADELLPLVYGELRKLAAAGRKSRPAMERSGALLCRRGAGLCGRIRSPATSQCEISGAMGGELFCGFRKAPELRSVAPHHHAACHDVRFALSPEPDQRGVAATKR